MKQSANKFEVSFQQPKYVATNENNGSKQDQDDMNGRHGVRGSHGLTALDRFVLDQK